MLVLVLVCLGCFFRLAILGLGLFGWLVGMVLVGCLGMGSSFGFLVGGGWAWCLVSGCLGGCNLVCTCALWWG